MSSDAQPNDAQPNAAVPGTDSSNPATPAAGPAEPARPARRPWFGLGAAAFTVGLGVLAGVGTFTFGYGKGASYMSNNPTGCANCHVMQEHYVSWQHSSHHHVAVCNDCHLPHNFVGKWYTKADNGFFHSLAFTLQDYHEPIRIKPRNRRVTQNSCLSCHKEFVHALMPPVTDDDRSSPAAQETHSCVHCHANVGHAFRSP